MLSKRVKSTNTQKLKENDEAKKLRFDKMASVMLGDNVGEQYRCSICNYFMLCSITQSCFGHLACKDCYDEKLSENPSICPIEKEPFQEDFPKHFADKAKEKEIGNLPCKCFNEKCTWKGCLRDFFKEHETKCAFQVKQCQFCDKSFEKEDENSHLSKCEGFFREGPCLYKNVGCTYIANSKEDMKEHHYQSVQLHFMCEKLRSDKLEAKVTELSLQSANNKRRNEQLSKLHYDDQNKVAEQLLGIKTSQDDYIKEHAQSSSSTQRSSASFNSKSNISTDSFIGDMADVKSSLADLDLRFQLHENSTHDGYLLWKINNYNKRKSDATSGHVTALHSSPCFTSRYGYKYCLRLYLNGDGMGRGNHLSLFLVIMKSEYDNVLQWPFQMKVKFTMVNQVDRNCDIMEKMIPDKNSSSFQKPTKEMNIASGCPQFLKIDRLKPDGFLKDDSLFIEVNIQ